MKRSGKVLDSIFLNVGKIVVFTGAFCGLLVVLDIILSFLSPFVLTVASYCLENIEKILIGVFILASLAYGSQYLVDLYESRKGNKVSDIDNK